MSTDHQLTGINSLSDLVKRPSLSAYLDLSVNHLELDEILDLVWSKGVHIENTLLQEPNEQSDRERAQLVGKVCRFALFNASANGLAGNVNDQWLPILVKDGLCTPELALCLATRMKYDPFVADMLRELAPFFAKSEKLIKQAVAVADQLAETYWRYVGLSALVPYLPESNERIDEVLRVTPTLGTEIGQVKILVTLLPHLSRPKFKTTLKMALKALQQIEGYDHIVRAIVRLLPWFPHASSELLLQTLWKLIDKEFPELSPLLTQNMIAVPDRIMLRRYFAVVAWFGILNALESQSLTMEEYLYLDLLVPYLPKNLRQGFIEEALRLLYKVRSPYHKACGLAQLVPNLPLNQSATVLSEALRAARKTKHEDARALALIRVSRCMESVEQVQLIQEALPMLGNPTAGFSAQALAQLLSLFSLQEAKKHLAQILTSLTELNDQSSRFVTTVLLDREQINTPEKNDLLKKLVKRWYRQAFLTQPLELVQVLPYLSPEEQAPLVSDVLVETNRLSEAHTRSYALRHIFPFVPLDKREAVMDELIESALAIKVSSEKLAFGGVMERAQELSLIARLAPECKRDFITEEAIRTVFKMYFEWSRVEGLRRMYGSDYFHEYMSNLLPLFSEERALQILRHIEPRFQPSDRWRLAISLYARLTPEEGQPIHEWIMSRMLELDIPKEQSVIYNMIRTCILLAPTLTDECKKQIVNRARSMVNLIENISFQVRALLYLAPHLEGSTQQQILQQAFEGIEKMHPETQMGALERFASEITGLPDKLEVWACIRALHLAGNLERQELLHVLQVLAPRIRALAGIKAAQEAVRALNGIAEFFV